MTLNNVIAFSAVAIMSSIAFAADEDAAYDQQNADVQYDLSAEAAPNYYHGGYGRSWICAAESVHGGQHYYGDYSSSRHQAQHSALHECEHHEGHACVLAGCSLQ